MWQAMRSKYSRMVEYEDVLVGARLRGPLSKRMGMTSFFRVSLRWFCALEETADSCRRSVRPRAEKIIAETPVRWPDAAVLEYSEQDLDSC